jgi:hypothetical protein
MYDRHFVFSQLSDYRPWYTHFHNSHDFEDNIDCPVNILSSTEGNRSFVTIDVYVGRWVQNIHCLFTAICDGKSI